jgi:agmatinase
MTEKTAKRPRLDLPFTGVACFCKAPLCADRSSIDADVAILGVPFDLGIQLRSGTRMGPRAIREASTSFALIGMGYYDPELDENMLGGVRLVDCGDADMVHMDAERSLGNAYEEAKEIISQNVFLVVLGGDHAVPIPILNAYEEKGPLHVIQFDTHLDYVDERFGIRQGHNNTMRRLAEMDHISGMTQIGMHGLSSSTQEIYQEARDAGSTIITLREFRELGTEGVLAKIPEGVNYYVTIDIDAMDASIAPGTGLPSLGGMYYRELMDTLRGIVKRGNVIGFDLCEVAPQYDPAGVTAFTAAGIIVEFLGSIFSERKKRAQKKP